MQRSWETLQRLEQECECWGGALGNLQGALVMAAAELELQGARPAGANVPRGREGGRRRELDVEMRDEGGWDELEQQVQGMPDGPRCVLRERP